MPTLWAVLHYGISCECCMPGVAFVLLNRLATEQGATAFSQPHAQQSGWHDWVHSCAAVVAPFDQLSAIMLGLKSRCVVSLMAHDDLFVTACRLLKAMLGCRTTEQQL